MSEQKRETRDELIEIIARSIHIGHSKDISKEIAVEYYNRIRDHILTPKIKELLKAIGPRPERCQSCSKCNRPYNSVRNACDYNCQILDATSMTDYHEVCPLLTAEELKGVLDE